MNYQDLASLDPSLIESLACAKNIEDILKYPKLNILKDTQVYRLNFCNDPSKLLTYTEFEQLTESQIDYLTAIANDNNASSNFDQLIAYPGLKTINSNTLENLGKTSKENLEVLLKYDKLPTLTRNQIKALGETSKENLEILLKYDHLSTLRYSEISELGKSNKYNLEKLLNYSGLNELNKTDELGKSHYFQIGSLGKISKDPLERLLKYPNLKSLTSSQIKALDFETYEEKDNVEILLKDENYNLVDEYSLQHLMHCDSKKGIALDKLLPPLKGKELTEDQAFALAIIRSENKDILNEILQDINLKNLTTEGILDLYCSKVSNQKNLTEILKLDLYSKSNLSNNCAIEALGKMKNIDKLRKITETLNLIGKEKKYRRKNLTPEIIKDIDETFSLNNIETVLQQIMLA